MKPGLLPLEPDERDIALSSVYTPSAFSSLPATFGARGLEWGMLGNEKYGDCYWASAAHEVMAEAHLAGRSPFFNEVGVLRTYAEYLGLSSWNPGSGYPSIPPSLDQGTEPREGAKFRKHQGVRDAEGRAHRIGVYVFEETPDYERLLSAIWTFGAITLCFNLPQSAEEQFESGLWSVERNSPILGGHAVAGIARASGNYLVGVSGGKEILITEAFTSNYLQCAMIYISGSLLDDSGRTPAGLDKPALLKALKEIA